MKKIILSMVFVFASVAMVNANSNVKLVNDSMLDKVESVRDCVDGAMSNVEDLAGWAGEDIRGEYQDYYLGVYMELYTECMANN